MEDIGSLLFYIVLGIIALAGSFQGKGKKKPGAPKPVQRRPGTITSKPPLSNESTSSRPQATPVPAPAPAPRPQPSPARPIQPVSRPAQKYMPAESSMEGSYEEPMAREFSREGSYSGTAEGQFSTEGTKRGGLAEAFANEGSIADSMAAAFAAEGSSAFGHSSIKEFIHNEISDSEIGDAPVYDYNKAGGADLLTEGFDLKKAVIYSSVLDRKEYSY